MKFIVTSAVMVFLLILCCACARPMAKAIEPQIMQVRSEPMMSDYLDPRKKELCANARKVALMAWVVMQSDYPNVASHVAACEIADEEAYWIISLEERDDNSVLRRKVDVMYFLLYNEGNWDVLRQDPIMQEGTFFDETRNKPLAPIPEPTLPDLKSAPINL